MVWFCCCATVDNDVSPVYYSEVSRVDYEEALKWKEEGFEYLFFSKSGQKAFWNYLVSVLAEENFMFYYSVEEYKKEKDAETQKKMANSIYELHIHRHSKKEISIDYETKNAIVANIKTPTSSIFDKAQVAVYRAMKEDMYDKFLLSEGYQRLIASGKVEEL